MADLISRRVAIEVARSHEVELPLYSPKETDIFWNDAIDIICDELESLSSAEPERHGRWEFIGDQMFQCSECGHTFVQKFLEGWRESVHEPLFPPHCPNCGSYNGGGANE